MTHQEQGRELARLLQACKIVDIDLPTLRQAVDSMEGLSERARANFAYLFSLEGL